MSTELIVIGLIVGLIFFISSHIQAKEIATFAAKLRCDSRGLLMLDQTVAITSITTARDRQGRMHWKRTFRFEFSQSGDDRYQGTVVLLGKEVIAAHLDTTSDVV